MRINCKKKKKRINYKWAQGNLTEGDENVLKLMMVAVPLSKVIFSKVI